MKRFALLTVAAGVLGLGITVMSPAQAAPASNLGGLKLLETDGATTVRHRRHCRRVCYRHRGHYHCRIRCHRHHRHW